MFIKLRIRWSLATCTLPAWVLAGCGQGMPPAPSETEEPIGQGNKVLNDHSDALQNLDSPGFSEAKDVVGRENRATASSPDAGAGTTSSRFGHRRDRPLRQVDDLGVSELRNFLAGKRIKPGGPSGGSEIFEADGTWKADSQAVAATYREGFWEIRRGPDDTPALCTTEIKRNFIRLPSPLMSCRSVSVSVYENRARISYLMPSEVEYFVTISPITN